MSDPRRKVRGLRVHYDGSWDYSLLRPLDWYQYDMQDRYGFIYSPEQDPRTGFYVFAQDLSDELESSVEEADLSALRRGMLKGLKRLPDCEISHEKEIAKGFAIGFEVMLTFTLDGQTCKRLMRLLYNDRQQFTLYGQGVPVEEYEVFHDTFEFMYHSFVFGDLRMSLGAPAVGESTILWEGEGENVQTRPKRRRDHAGRLV